MREILRPGLTLFIVALISSVSLAVVNSVTAEPIARQKLLTRNTAMQELLPAATDFQETEEVPRGAGIKGYFVCSDGTNNIGYVISAAPTGYAGPIEMLIAFDTQGILAGIRVTSHSETPGLGSYVTAESFTDQYVGKSGQLSVTVSRNPGPQEIDALTSATISTKAVTDGVNTALRFYDQHLKGAN